MWTIFKVLTEVVTKLLQFYVLVFFGCKADRILASRTGIKPAPTALEAWSLNTGLSRQPQTKEPVPGLQSIRSYCSGWTGAGCEKMRVCPIGALWGANTPTWVFRVVHVPL